jgi:hypothetical protein
MIYKRVIIPDSNIVYKICRGVSTGHAFTSLITTLCAYITLSTGVDRSCRQVACDHYEEERLLLATYIGNAGDDCNIRLPAKLISALYNDISLRSGHTIDDIHDNGYIHSNNSLSRVTFLKKRFDVFS